MRGLLPVALVVSFSFVACQDSAASNPERETHMGAAHAVPAASVEPLPTAPRSSSVAALAAPVAPPGAPPSAVVPSAVTPPSPSARGAARPAEPAPKHKAAP